MILTKVRNGKNLIRMDYRDFISRGELFHWIKGREKDIQAFIHMGAKSSTKGMDGKEYYLFNYRYTIDLARYALEHHIRFIYASSAATYGDGRFGFFDHQEKIKTVRAFEFVWGFETYD